MFANFTEETCTGTGDTLTLTGATAGMLPFSASFTNGDLVSYALEDSGGSIKIAGIGAYNSAGNTITRSDNWNYNGSAVNKNPTVNLTLGAGTHKIRCAASALMNNGIQTFNATPLNNNFKVFADNWVSAFGTGSVLSLNFVYATPAFFSSHIKFSKLAVEVVTADAAGLANICIASCGANGRPKRKLVDVAAVDVTTTGEKVVTLSSELLLPPGRYFMLFQTNSDVIRMRNINNMTHGMASSAYKFRSYSNGPQCGNPGSMGIPDDLSFINNGSDPLLATMICPIA